VALQSHEAAPLAIFSDLPRLFPQSEPPFPTTPSLIISIAMNSVNMAHDIRAEYKNECQQSAALRLLRIHRGLYTEDTGDAVVDARIAKAQLIRAKSFEKGGLDVTITLVRGLLALGFQTRGETSRRVKALMDLAWKNIGWDQAEDLREKRRLVEEVWPEKAHDKEHLEKRCVVHSLLNTEFSDLFRGQEDFQFFGSRCIFQTGSGPLQHELLYLTDMVDNPNDHDIVWNGQQPLTAHLSKLLAPAMNTKYGDDDTSDIEGLYYPTGASPKFIRVLYIPDDEQPPRPFRALFEFEIKVPAIWDTGYDQDAKEYGIEEHHYQLCAVVRKESSLGPDDVRLYWKNGSVIEPAEVGEFREKAQGTGAKPWSVEDPQSQTFILFYFRVATPNGWSVEYERTHIKEFITPKGRQPPPSAPTGPRGLMQTSSSIGHNQAAAGQRVPRSVNSGSLQGPTSKPRNSQNQGSRRGGNNIRTSRPPGPPNPSQGVNATPVGRQMSPATQRPETRQHRR
jgi:hypothetical protein